MHCSAHEYFHPFSMHIHFKDMMKYKHKLSTKFKMSQKCNTAYLNKGQAA